MILLIIIKFNRSGTSSGSVYRWAVTVICVVLITHTSTVGFEVGDIFARQWVLTAIGLEALFGCLGVDGTCPGARFLPLPVSSCNACQIDESVSFGEGVSQAYPTHGLWQRIFTSLFCLLYHGIESHVLQQVRFCARANRIGPHDRKDYLAAV